MFTTIHDDTMAAHVTVSLQRRSDSHWDRLFVVDSIRKTANRFRAADETCLGRTVMFIRPPVTLSTKILKYQEMRPQQYTPSQP